MNAHTGALCANLTPSWDKQIPARHTTPGDLLLTASSWRPLARRSGPAACDRTPTTSRLLLPACGKQRTTPPLSHNLLLAAHWRPHPPECLPHAAAPCWPILAAASCHCPPDLQPAAAADSHNSATTGGLLRGLLLATGRLPVAACDWPPTYRMPTCSRLAATKETSHSPPPAPDCLQGGLGLATHTHTPLSGSRWSPRTRLR